MGRDIQYDKLVRDLIPEIIKKQNKQIESYKADEAELKTRLCEKLIEELNEFKETPNVEEAADLLEVIEGLIDVFQLDYEQVLKIKEEKKSERGGFKEGIILTKVSE